MLFRCKEFMLNVPMTLNVTHEVKSSYSAKGRAPLGNIWILATRTGAEKRIAARLEGPCGESVHQQRRPMAPR